MTTFLGRSSETDDHLADLVAQGLDVRIVPAGLTKAEVLSEFATTLQLPEWFGHNWDALLDALRDLGNDDGRRIELVWDRVRTLRDADRRTYRTVLEILEQVEAERGDLRVTVIAR